MNEPIVSKRFANVSRDAILSKTLGKLLMKSTNINAKSNIRTLYFGQYMGNPTRARDRCCLGFSNSWATVFAENFKLRLSK